MIAPGSDDDEFFFSPTSTGLQHLQDVSYNYGSPNSRGSLLNSDDQHFSNTVGQRGKCDSINSEESLSPKEQLIHDDQLSRGRVQRQGSIVDGLLHEIYDRWHYGRHDSIDSDTLTECSSTSEFFFHGRHDYGGYLSGMDKRHAGQLNRSYLQNQSKCQLERLLADLQHSIAVMNVRLVKQLKRRDRCLARLQRNSDIVTAILQAASLKRLRPPSLMLLELCALLYPSNVYPSNVYPSIGLPERLLVFMNDMKEDLTE
ncbi:TBC1 domain family member 30 [Biomphalaria pfeifferi]|uniref:TBC1 domain family member 30 n=1 Tax=Biomphalaria pfeifferi TaxID=112525 RepID=A0AAD8EY50_BIOPF|nr:TBC1 domain family member 30 [Biomphalaria pfeifferi]